MVKSEVLSDVAKHGADPRQLELLRLFGLFALRQPT
jgi:hypothetical protein